ncbi:DUF2897 family protein [Vibrio sp. ZSDE26]|uniref:DUF2897 family protein n=1 Tax=Vibrio amylolyticus TaxID=2847292 RepID=A0A9X1XMH3_9VIBR|nr:DUF2897 family protein [Vibrio amylolyticus]MCK6265441.1 DUF2897 family protein [Vibrio amylolyticus]
MDLLTNPWFISFLAMGFMVSNIMALKYVSKLKLGQFNKSQKQKEALEKKKLEEDAKGNENNNEGSNEADSESNNDSNSDTEK